MVEEEIRAKIELLKREIRNLKIIGVIIIILGITLTVILTGITIKELTRFNPQTHECTEWKCYAKGPGWTQEWPSSLNDNCSQNGTMTTKCTPWDECYEENKISITKKCKSWNNKIA